MNTILISIIPNLKKKTHKEKHHHHHTHSDKKKHSSDKETHALSSNKDNTLPSDKETHALPSDKDKPTLSSDKDKQTPSDKDKQTLSSDKDKQTPSDKDKQTLSSDKDKQTPSDKDKQTPSDKDTKKKDKKDKKDKKKSDKDNLERKRKTISAVREDHIFIQNGLENLLSMDCSNDENREAKQRLLNDVIVYLSQHVVAEEIVIYHSVKKIDKHKSEDAKKQNIEMEKLLYEIDHEYGTNIDNPEKLDEKLKELQKLFLNHNDNEETNILQTLEKDYPNEKIENINDWYQKVKKIAPTRPHPGGPHNIVGQIATGPALVFVDMIRDMKKKFNYD